MKPITSTDYNVYFNTDAFTALNEHLEKNNYSKIFILVDSNTNANCLPVFLPQLVTNCEVEIIEIEAGEIHKNIETCTGVWNAISELGGDRKSLMINLGGGVVTDLGGFVAATYMRGINFINIPTTLLSMVDASVGGKTGIDLGTLKNQVGVFCTPEMVLISTDFLNTLPSNEMRSGMAEMLKHGLIADENYWNFFKNLQNLTLEDLDKLIYDSVIIKNNVVLQDLKESNLRKTLNFGHTLGHAIESFFLNDESKTTLLHGEAIAIGMILAAHLSHQKLNFSIEKVDEIKSVILNYFEKVAIEENDLDTIISLMKHDKKNTYGTINFVLLEGIGNPTIDIKVDNNMILKAFEYYKN
ncbi:3-dehydroquinate synthase [Pustulibacterium marinum]|uniref:3-dehydroquinate synthase n=1 Tax=Pustulibacterium marinum TaxID=1224947 RepID=A0A1I7IGH2_9FLAO|nr:3-dehydroquinate synthase [Pustulibacterium marinum]SFU72021.1 3-dehydroquinate synthase [Pustulibacterium marinum]